MKAAIFSAVSTISISTGRSIESRNIFAVCKWLLAPKPIAPRSTVGAGEAGFARLEDNRLIQGQMMAAVALADVNSQDLSGGWEGHGPRVPGGLLQAAV